MKQEQSGGRVANGEGGQFITLYQADKLMSAHLIDYEKRVVEPRHLETQNDLRDLKRMFWALIMLALMTFTGIITVLATRPSQAQTQTHT